MPNGSFPDRFLRYGLCSARLFKDHVCTEIEVLESAKYKASGEKAERARFCYRFHWDSTRRKWERSCCQLFHFNKNSRWTNGKCDFKRFGWEAVVDAETTQLTKNTATRDEDWIDVSTENVDIQTDTNWDGRVSDKEITRKCKFLDFVEYGDDIMADRGFNVTHHSF